MSKYDPDYTSAHYDRYGTRESSRWEQGARAEMQRAIFRYHLEQRVRQGDKILDAGAGPGTYAKDLLSLGAKVTCLDISKFQLDTCRQQVPDCEAYIHGSVTDLSQFDSGTFDMALAYGGVLSYCFDQASTAASELVRVTRPGGLVGLSVMNLFGTLHSFLPGVVEIETSLNEQIVRTGNLSRDINNGHECHLFRVEELRNLLSDAGLEDVELHASGWLIPDNETQVPPLGSEAWLFLFRSELEASRESPGAGTHIIGWGRVPDEV